MNTHKHQVWSCTPILTPALIFSVQLLAATALCWAARLCKALFQHPPCTHCTRDHSGQSLALPQGTSSPDSTMHANTNGKSDNRHKNQGKPPSCSWKKRKKKSDWILCMCKSEQDTLFSPERKDTKDKIITTGLRLFIPPGATKAAALKPRFRVPYTSHTHGTPPQTSSSALLHRRGSRPSYSAATMPGEKREAAETTNRRGQGSCGAPAPGPSLSLRASLTWDGAAPRREELTEPPRRRHRPRPPGPPPCSRGLRPRALPVTALTPLPWQRSLKGPARRAARSGRRGCGGRAGTAPSELRD